MSSKVVIADTGSLISLAMTGNVNLIEEVFGIFYIARAVWEELLKYEDLLDDPILISRLEKQVVNIHSTNHLSVIMDSGESEKAREYFQLAMVIFKD